MGLLSLIASLLLRLTRTRRIASADQCQAWADAPWVAEVGVKDRGMREMGCTETAPDVWEQDPDICGRHAFDYSRREMVGTEFYNAMARQRCTQLPDGGWTRT